MLLRSKKFIILGLGLSSLAFMPTLLSTTAGNSLVAKMISESTSSKCYLKGRFSYFSSQKISELILQYDHLTFRFENVTVDQISAMLFGKNMANIVVDKFSITQISQSSSLNIKSADLSPNIKLKPFGLFCQIKLSNGVFIDQSSKEAISNIKGSIFYGSSNPINIALEGVCGETGLLDLKGTFDEKSNALNSTLTIKNCPSSVIPESFFKPLITNNFDLNLAFDGAINKGHALYQFTSPDLQMQGEFDVDDDRIVVSSMNKLFIKRATPYVYKDLQVNDLSGQIALQNLDLKLSSIPEIKRIFCTYEGSTGTISYQGNKSGPFKINGDLSQENDDVLIGASLNQGSKELLKCGAFYSIKEAVFKKGFVKASEVPLIFPVELGSLAVGNNFSLNVDFIENNGIVEANVKGFSPNIKNLETSASINKNIINISTLFVSYEDASNKGSLNGTGIQADVTNIQAINGSIQSSITSFYKIDSKYLPLDLKVDLAGLDFIKTKLDSPFLSLQGVGSYNISSQDFLFRDSWQGTVTISPTLSNLTFAKDSIQGHIQIPSGSKISSLPIKVTLDPFLLNSPKDISVKEALISAEIKPFASSLVVDAKAFFYQKEAQGGSFDASIQINKGTIQKAQVTLKNPPLEALSGINPEIEKAAQLFGKNLILDFNLLDNGQNIDVNASSENLKLQGAFGYKNHLYLIRPIKGSLHIKTLDIPFIQTTLPFKLKKPFDLGLEIKALDIPLINSPISDISINGSFNILNLSLEQNKKMVQMEALNASFAKAKGSNPITFNVDADVFSSYDKVVTSGSLNASFNISGLSGNIQNIETSNASINALFKLDNFPTLAMDFLQSRANLPFSSTFGETLSAKFEVNHNPNSGSFKLFASGKETVLKLNAKAANGIYSLVDDVVFQTRLSPELSKFLFSSKPLGIEKLTSDYPLVCRISSTNSQFTLFPFRSEMLSLSSCMFDFGRVRLDSSKVLPQTLNLLKSSSRGDNLSVWFQPIKTSIKNGLMNVSRFDFLVQDAFQMALWGDVDFNQKQVGLTLGLTASCLQKAFGISELPKTYVMQIPVYGSFEDIKIDSKKATSKIAKILALQHGGSLLEQFGGKSGGAIGGVLKELSKIPDGDKVAPEPQTPFPWETSSSKTSSKSADKPENKKAIRSSDSPIKQLMKVFF